MKKLLAIFTFLVCVVLPFSCIRTEYGNVPKATTEVYNTFFQQIYSSLLYSSSKFEQAKYLSMWQAAQTNQERYEIENKYFEYYKIQESENRDSIYLFLYGNLGDKTVFVTGAKSIDETEAVWNILPAYDDIEELCVINKASNTWTIETPESSVTGKKYNYTLQSSEEMESLKMDGEGSFSNDDFTFSVQGAGFIFLDESPASCRLNSGLINFEYLGYPAEIRILNEDHLEIYYRGVSEDWGF